VLYGKIVRGSFGLIPEISFTDAERFTIIEHKYSWILLTYSK